MPGTRLERSCGKYQRLTLEPCFTRLAWERQGVGSLGYRFVCPRARLVTEDLGWTRPSVNVKKRLSPEP